MRKILLTLALALGSILLCNAKSEALTCTQTHIFITGETLTAVVLNLNPANEITCINNIDSTNVGANGFLASNIIATSVLNATFGGSQKYTFANGLTVNGSSLDVGITSLGTTGGGSQMTASGLTIGGNILSTNGVFSTSAATMQLCPNSSCTVFVGATTIQLGSGNYVPSCRFSTATGTACASTVKSGYFILTLGSCPSNSQCTAAGAISGLPFTSSTTWGCAVSEAANNFSGGGSGVVELVVIPSSGSAGSVEEFNGSTSNYAAKAFAICEGT